MSKTILLDLNFTLAKKVKIDYSTWRYFPKKDVYCEELIKKLNDSDFNIILITARPINYKEVTIPLIEAAGLKCNKYVFKPKSKKFMKAQQFKKEYALKLISSGRYSVNDFIAIESNKEVSKSYREIGIKEVYTREQYLYKSKQWPST